MLQGQGKDRHGWGRGTTEPGFCEGRPAPDKVVHEATGRVKKSHVKGIKAHKQPSAPAPASSCCWPVCAARQPFRGDRPHATPASLPPASAVLPTPGLARPYSRVKWFRQAVSTIWPETSWLDMRARSPVSHRGTPP